METIKDFINFMLVVIPLGTVVRVGSCIVSASVNGDEADSYKKKARNALIYMVLAETVAGTLRVIVGYFGGTVIWN